MPGLDTDIVVHRLPIKEGSTPIKQKLRRSRPDMSKKIKDEVEKQFNAGFLKVVSYPPWIANIVLSYPKICPPAFNQRFLYASSMAQVSRAYSGHSLLIKVQIRIS